ncbi:hypothetical protein EYR36_006886 [Pleurotus pulmonarius]|nr:hypothetical protein EYR36_006886 [Pleurotus pulmonarius]
MLPQRLHQALRPQFRRPLRLPLYQRSQLSRASAMEVYQQLQVSNAAITGRGAIKLGVPDEHDPNFTHFFLRGNLQFLAYSTPDPDRLKVSADSKLILKIAPYWHDDQATPSKLKLPSPRSLPSKSKSAKPTKVPIRSTAPASGSSSRAYIEILTDDESDHELSPTKRAKLSKTQDNLEWLRNIIQKRPGYDEFIQNRNRRLDNPDLIVHWAFAADVLAEFHHKVSGASGRRITKAAIQTALGVGETTLSQAIEATRLI